MAQSRLIHLEYYDEKAKVRLAGYADTIIFERTKDGKNVITAIRFGGYPEMVRGLADAMYGGATVEATIQGQTQLMQCKPKGYDRQLAHEGVYATVTMMVKDDAQLTDDAKDGDEPEIPADGEEKEKKPRTCYIFVPAGNKDRLYEELDRKTAAPLSEAQWKAITIGDGNDQLRSSKVTIHYNSTTQGSVAVTVNGSAVKWTDASPFINSDGRTMVPLRAVGDALGLSVNWDGAKREAIFSNGSKTIFFPIDSNTAHTSDGRQITMDTAAIVIDGRTYAPIRYLAEFFGFTVDWDGGTKTVIIKGSGTVQNSNPVLAAYKDYIENKYEKEMFYTAESFALYDINNDGIVDLLVHGGGETNWTKLFTFQNSKVVFIKETTDITPYDNGVVELTFHSGSGTENHSYHKVSKEFEFELIYGYTTNVRDVPMSYTESTDGYTTKVSATTVENKVRQIIGNTKSAIEYYENNQVNRNSHLQ